MSLLKRLSHDQGGEYNAGGDQDITEEEALEIIEVLTTPEPAPVQVPNAPVDVEEANRSMLNPLLHHQGQYQINM